MLIPNLPSPADLEKRIADLEGRLDEIKALAMAASIATRELIDRVLKIEGAVGSLITQVDNDLDARLRVLEAAARERAEAEEARTFLENSGADLPQA